MGGVCSCVFKDDDNKKLRSNDEDKSRGLSGKLKSMRRRRTSDSYYSDNYGSSRRKSSKRDEVVFNFSGELVPMPPLRNDSTKVFVFKGFFMMCNFSRDTYELCLNTVLMQNISSLY